MLAHAWVFLVGVPWEGCRVPRGAGPEGQLCPHPRPPAGALPRLVRRGGARRRAPHPGPRPNPPPHARGSRNLTGFSGQQWAMGLGTDPNDRARRWGQESCRGPRCRLPTSQGQTPTPVKSPQAPKKFPGSAVPTGLPNDSSEGSARFPQPCSDDLFGYVCAPMSRKRSRDGCLSASRNCASRPPCVTARGWLPAVLCSLAWFCGWHPKAVSK